MFFLLVKNWVKKKTVTRIGSALKVSRIQRVEWKTISERERRQLNTSTVSLLYLGSVGHLESDLFLHSAGTEEGAAEQEQEREEANREGEGKGEGKGSRRSGCGPSACVVHLR